MYILTLSQDEQKALLFLGQTCVVIDNSYKAEKSSKTVSTFVVGSSMRTLPSGFNIWHPAIVSSIKFLALWSYPKSRAGNDRRLVQDSDCQ